MADFSIAYAITCKNEGGYANVQGDAGGETYCGISRVNNPSWKGWAIVDIHKPLERGEYINDPNMPELLQDFYKENYWDKIDGDNIPLQELGNQAFDTAVLQGVPEALKLLNES